MPRASKGARLWLKPEERDATGKVRKRAVWIIRDGSKSVVTGCAAPDRHLAEAALAEYLTDKHDNREVEKDLPARNILVTDVLALYSQDVVPTQARPDKCDQRLLQLGTWWVGKTLSDVNGKSCRAYTAWRVAQPWKSAKPTKTGNKPRMMTPAGVRRELEDLRAAINYHRKEGYTRDVIEVTLPDKSPAKTRWLTREEAARLIWACWRTREVQNGKPTGKRPWRHLARFILVGLYTGTRAAAICNAALAPREGSGYVDLENGLFYRKAIGQAETNKRQPPVRLPPRLLAHMRRWAADRGDRTISKAFVVEHNGVGIGEVNKGFASAVVGAGLSKDVTPHVLRHTSATWMMQGGADLWDAAGFLGMSVAILERTYGHHHPDHQASAVAAVTSKPNKGATKPVGGQDGDRYNGTKRDLPTRRKAAG